MWRRNRHAAQMNAKVSALMARQEGLALRRQATEAGLAPGEIDRLVRLSEWVVVRRGVYATSGLWESLDQYVGRPRLRALAASLTMTAQHALSHDSAALMHDLEILAAHPEMVHVTRHGVLGGRTKYGVKHHKAPHAPEQVVRIQGFAVLDPARTVVDMAREHGRRHGLPAVDSFLRHGLDRADLWKALRPMTCWPGVTEARWAVEHGSGLADNPFESLGRLLAIELWEGPVEAQFGLTDGHRTVWCDLRVGRHVFEMDGRLKYRSVGDGGVAEQDPDEVLWQEKLRQDFICGFKLGVSRVTFVDTLPASWRQPRRGSGASSSIPGRASVTRSTTWRRTSFADRTRAGTRAPLSPLVRCCNGAPVRITPRYRGVSGRGGPGARRP